MRYPRRQADTVGLIDNMISGITEHPDIFVHCDIAVLQLARDEFSQASAALTDAQSKAALAAADKLEKYNKLCQIMKNQIKLGIVDTSSNPVELSLIGWGTKRPPNPIDPPGQPTNLKVTAVTDDTVFLNWKKPSAKSGGPVRTYIIERSTLLQSGWSDWQLTASVLNSDAKLTGQTAGCKSQYRVKAVNSSGQSLPSNTACVIL